MPAHRSYCRGALRAGVRKPPRKEPAGRRVGRGYLWGFDRAAVWVADALAGVVAGRSMIAMSGLAWEETGRLRCSAGSEVSRRAGVVKRRERVSWRRGLDRVLRRRRSARLAAAPEALDDDHPAAATGARFWSSCSVAGSIDGRGAAISSLARATLALQVALASNP